LVHGCLEGPEAGVYYRGEGIINKEHTEIEITLPEYVRKLANNFTVHITSHSNKILLSCSKVINNKFKVEKYEFCKNINEEVEFSWIVYGKRYSIEVEPLKDDVKIKGDGPYKYVL